MLIETTAGELRLALDKVKPAIEPRQTMPVLGCVLLADGGVTATDLDQEIMVKFAARRFQGRVAVPFRTLSGLIRALPAETDIRLQDQDRSIGRDASDYGVYVTFPGGRYWLPSIPAEDFPEWTVPDETAEVAAPDGFLGALAACAPFISTEETRYYLNGVCFSKDPEGRQVMVATDGHRMIAHDLGHGIEGSLILPHKAVHALLRLAAPARVRHGRGRMEFSIPGARLRTKLIDGTFPDWTRVVPKIPKEAPALTFNPLKLRAVLRRMQIGVDSRGRGSQIDLCANPAGDTVVVTAKAVDGGECAERIEGARAVNWSKLTSCVYSFNSGYLMQFCQTHCAHDEVVLTGENSGSPARIGPAEAAGAARMLTVLMPMRGGNGLNAGALLALGSAGNDPAADQREVA